MAEMTRVLVTGGAGFIGTNFVRYALQRHPAWEMVVLDKLTYAGNRENLRDLPRVTFIHGDITEPEDVQHAMQGVEAVVNFAAESHVDRSLIDPRPFIRTNVEGTLVLLEAARKAHIQRFLQVSTDEVYGDLAGTTHHSRETDPFAPRSPYAASKAAAEHLVFSYGISYGLEVVVTRGSNTYGPFQYPEKVIPLFITNAVADLPLPLYGDGSAVRDYLYVEDHAAAIDTVLHRGTPGRAYNIGAREEISGVAVAGAILELMGKPSGLMRFVPDRPGHDYRYSIDPSATEGLGWQRSRSFNEGLAETVGWYRAHEAWWKQLKERSAYRNHEQVWYEKRELEVNR